MSPKLGVGIGRKLDLTPSIRVEQTDHVAQGF